MLLPTPTTSTGPASSPSLTVSTAPALWLISLTGHHNGDTNLQRWSSFIGITTAIIGNILISIALNIQRYAHIRLNKEREQNRERLRNLKGKKTTGYGTQDLLEGSSGANGEASSGVGSTGVNGAKASSEITNGHQVYHNALDSQGENTHETDPLNRMFYSETSTATHSTLNDSTYVGKSSDTLTKKTYLRSPYWWAGITLMTIGEAGNFLAY